jgi:hypothetical protein
MYPFLWVQEPRSTIRKLSEFLGRPLGPKEEDIILEHSSFSFMSQSNIVNYSLLSKEIIDQSEGKFFRKGRPPSQPPSKYPRPILGPFYPFCVCMFWVGWLVGWFWFFETGFLCAALAVLELTL